MDVNLKLHYNESLKRVPLKKSIKTAISELLTLRSNILRTVVQMYNEAVATCRSEQDSKARVIV